MRGGGDSSSILDKNDLCLPDCPDDLWEPARGTYETTVSFGSCSLRVYYKARYACNTFCDVTIVQIQNLGCNGFSISQILDLVSARVIADALARGIPDGECKPKNLTDCVTQWRVSNGACWRYTPVTPNPIGAWQGNWAVCDQTTCCFSTYQVCLDMFGNQIITRTSQTQDYPCPWDPTGQCVPGCGG